MKALITGSNGLLGSHLVQEGLDQKINIIATSKQENRVLTSTPFPFDFMDITRHTDTRYIIEANCPDVVINTAAITNANRCEKDKELCWNTNVVAVENLIDCCNDLGIHFIQISSDFIFDGINGPYAEGDQANPLNYYGLSKLEAEQGTIEKAKHWTIIRASMIMGDENSGLVALIKNTLSRGQGIQVNNDQYRTPLFARDLAKGCWTIARHGKTGIFHLAGEEYLSVLEMAMMIAEAYKLDKSLIRPVSTIELDEPARRPLKGGLKIEKARLELGFPSLSFYKGLTNMISKG